MCNKCIEKAIKEKESSEQVVEYLKRELSITGIVTKPLSEYSTKELVDEISKRNGVVTFQTDHEGEHEIRVINDDYDNKTTTIRETKGPAIILEVID